MYDPRAYLTLYAVLCLLAVVPLTVSAILGKVRGYRRNGFRWAYALIALVDGSVLAYSVHAFSSSVSGMAQVGLHFAATLPVILVIANLCSIQDRRYPQVWTRTVIRIPFSKVYLILFSLFISFSLLQFLRPYEILRLFAPAPVLTTSLQTPIMLAWGFFALLAAFVFFDSSVRWPYRLLRVQNASAGILMSALAIDAVLWTLIFGFRAFSSDSTRATLVSSVLSITNVTFTIELVSGLVAILSYYNTSEVSKRSEKLLMVFESSRRIQNIFESVPVHDWPYSGPYHYLECALDYENLSIECEDRQKARDAYRLALLMYLDGIADANGNKHITASQFLDLLHSHQQNLADPDISSRAPVLRRLQTYSLYDINQAIQHIVLRHAPVPATHIVAPMWLQLAWLAIHDAGLTPLQPDIETWSEAHAAYSIAKHDVWKKATS